MIHFCYTWTVRLELMCSWCSLSHCLLFWNCNKEAQLIHFTALTIYGHLIKSLHDHSLVFHNNLGFHGYARPPNTLLSYYMLLKQTDWERFQIHHEIFSTRLPMVTAHTDTWLSLLTICWDLLPLFMCECLYLFYVVLVFVQSFQVSGDGHFNEFQNGGLQAPEWKLTSFLRHHDCLLWPLLKGHRLNTSIHTQSCSKRESYIILNI